MLFIRRKRALPPGNQSGINADFTQRRNVFTFPIFHTHSTRNGHKKTRSLSTEIYAKITSEGNRRGWTCRSREWDFDTVIYIVKMAHSAHLLTKMLMMTLQMVEFKVCSGSQNYTIFHIFYFVEPLGTNQHLFTTMAWHRNWRQAISVSNGAPFYWWLQLKSNYNGSWTRNIVHSQHLAVKFLQGLYCDEMVWYDAFFILDRSRSSILTPVLGVVSRRISVSQDFAPDQVRMGI